jgi:hypothetical protein
VSRSSRPDVRNPILRCPEAIAALAECPPEARAALSRALSALSREWLATANKCWKTHKPPMATYWKANAANARHIALALRSIPEAELPL